MEQNLSIVDILLVEDNPGDVRLTKEALKDSKIKNSLFVVDNGEKAMDFLCKRNGYEDVPVPDLIILDLNLPKKNGKEVLSEIKSDETLKHIPVVVLTTSKADEDILKSYKLFANCYITKPLELDNFIEVVKTIENFWLTIVKLPPEMV